ncbi:SDR family oxidoreductase [Acidisoma cellulosilytica]|uniref:SDR family oxidoreductase n=1 Tax=Acidisoma cellulosilyticum TaxID=2802395 RepID=A0A963Z6A4_9PROT|nr:SDR family oxidoreductase [Acidisoma cellulosilyticum]MCB8883286.1 SDR family oxidoreductase [Acidisoma cellulosilyticum]
MASSQPVVLITGGARGIGRGIAERLVGDGWRAVIADRQKPVGLLPLPHRFVEGDVSDEADVAGLVAGIATGEGRLDALICNAGFMIRKPLEALSLAEWQSVLGTNLTSTFLLARAAAPLLRQAKGAIVTIASTRAHQSEPNTESYAASKGGILALTHALAVSLGPDIRVNAVSPGWIDTHGGALSEEDHAQHPAGRVGRVEDIASLVAWLVGPDSGFVTGSEFVVDGGMTRKMIYAE